MTDLEGLEEVNCDLFENKTNKIKARVFEENREHNINNASKTLKPPVMEAMQLLFGLVCKSFTKAILIASSKKRMAYYHALSSCSEFRLNARNLLGSLIILILNNILFQSNL